MNSDYTIIAQNERHNGLTAIEYAAIHTGQPCSGTPWLDDMIRAQRRERLAGQALAGLLTQPADAEYGAKAFAQASCEMVDALISALEGGAK